MTTTEQTSGRDNENHVPPEVLLTHIKNLEAQLVTLVRMVQLLSDKVARIESTTGKLDPILNKIGSGFNPSASGQEMW